VKFTVPQRGDKLKLLELADKNLTYYLQSKAILKEQNAKTPGWERVLKQLQADMKLKDLPVHIECFDNSNFQGSYPVAAMVCFKNAKPSKKDYRHFNIETVVGPDDFASMKEIVYRRYKRLLDEQQSLPNLIIIDGGKGQLSAAVESLRELDIEGKIAICGIAKRLEEIYVPGDSLPLYINKKSESLRLIQRIRDETHRFAITFHRSKRNKGTLTSELNGIKGIGQNTFEKLMQHYKSVKKIKEAPEAELVELVGTARAHRLLNYFREQQKDNAPTQEQEPNAQES
jgi:excinuclease ABC subunit C